MGSISWTGSALIDVQEIGQYVAQTPRLNAARLIQRLREAPRALENNPLSGGIVPEFGLSQVREIFVRTYRIIYCVEGDDCLVLAVIHGSRDLPTAFEPPNTRPKKEKPSP